MEVSFAKEPYKRDDILQKRALIVRRLLIVGTAYVCVEQTMYTNTYQMRLCYGVATMSRLLKTGGPFCKQALLKKGYSAKETSNLKEPTNCRHPLPICRADCVYKYISLETLLWGGYD